MKIFPAFRMADTLASQGQTSKRVTRQTRLLVGWQFCKPTKGCTKGTGESAPARHISQPCYLHIGCVTSAEEDRMKLESHSLLAPRCDCRCCAADQLQALLAPP
jgi:hypothetical protein